MTTFPAVHFSVLNLSSCPHKMSCSACRNKSFQTWLIMTSLVLEYKVMVWATESPATPKLLHTYYFKTLMLHNASMEALCEALKCNWIRLENSMLLNHQFIGVWDSVRYAHWRLCNSWRYCQQFIFRQCIWNLSSLPHKMSCSACWNKLFQNWKCFCNAFLLGCPWRS